MFWKTCLNIRHPQTPGGTEESPKKSRWPKIYAGKQDSSVRDDYGDSWNLSMDTMREIFWQGKQIPLIFGLGSESSGFGDSEVMKSHPPPPHHHHQTAAWQLCVVCQRWGSVSELKKRITFTKHSLQLLPRKVCNLLSLSALPKKPWTDPRSIRRALLSKPNPKLL